MGALGGNLGTDATFPLSDSLGNGLNETAGFDARGRLQWLIAVNGSNTTVYSINNSSTPISYAPNSNITAANDNANGSWSYSYDPLNRVNQAAKTGNTIKYFDATYGSDIDRDGNRQIQYVNGSGSPNLTYDQSTNHITNSQVTYDAAGNVRTWNDGSATHTYTYDAEGRMVSVDSGGIQYTYDAFGRRVEKNVSGTKTDYVYDVGGNIVATVDGYWGTMQRGEIWAGGRHLGTYGNNTTYFSHSDWLGSERVRSDVSGNAYQSCTDSPYGDNLQCNFTGSNMSLFYFAGMELDSETGFYHTQYRYYNPKLGSWMTPDPAGMAAADLSDPQSLNRYAYSFNNPINYIDPLGLDGCSPTLQNPCPAPEPGCGRDGSGEPVPCPPPDNGGDGPPEGFGPGGGGFGPFPGPPCSMVTIGLRAHVLSTCGEGGDPGADPDPSNPPPGNPPHQNPTNPPVLTAVKKFCSGYPDVTQVGAGADAPMVLTGGLQATLNANGNSGELMTCAP